MRVWQPFNVVGAGFRSKELLFRLRCRHRITRSSGLRTYVEAVEAADFEPFITVAEFECAPSPWICQWARLLARWLRILSRRMCVPVYWLTDFYLFIKRVWASKWDLQWVFETNLLPWNGLQWPNSRKMSQCRYVGRWKSRGWWEWTAWVMKTSTVYWFCSTETVETGLATSSVFVIFVLVLL